MAQKTRLKARPTRAAMNDAIARAARAEEAARAWRARFWFVESHGVLVPSDEDAALFDELIGPMPHYAR